METGNSSDNVITHPSPFRSGPLDPASPGARIALTVVQLFLSTVGAVGSVAMIICILRDSTQRVWGNYLHVSLATAHTLQCVIPSSLHLLLVNYAWDGLLSPSRKLCCLLYQTTMGCLAMANFLLMTQIAVCRCFILTYRKSANMTRPHWIGSIWVAWLVVLAYGVYATFIKMDLLYGMTLWPCNSAEMQYSWQRTMRRAHAPIGVLLSLCFVAIVTSYIIMFVVTRPPPAVSPYTHAHRNRAQTRVCPVEEDGCGHLPETEGQYTESTQRHANTGQMQDNTVAISMVTLDHFEAQRIGNATAHSEEGSSIDNEVERDKANPLAGLFRRTTYKNFLVLVFFILSYLPLCVVWMVRTNSQLSGHTMDLAAEGARITFLMINCVNPLLYTSDWPKVKD